MAPNQAKELFFTIFTPRGAMAGGTKMKSTVPANGKIPVRQSPDFRPGFQDGAGGGLRMHSTQQILRRIPCCSSKIQLARDRHADRFIPFARLHGRSLDGKLRVAIKKLLPVYVRAGGVDQQAHTSAWARCDSGSSTTATANQPTIRSPQFPINFGLTDYSALQSNLP